MRPARRAPVAALAAVLTLTALALGAALTFPRSVAGAPAPAPQASSSRYLGRPLAEALVDLQSQGLRIIFSNELVRPDMKVVAEPTAAWLHDVLEQLLAPHGLTARVGPGGSLMVVRVGPAPITVRLVAPVPGEATAGEVEVVAEVSSADPISWVDFFVNGWPAARVRTPPYRATVTVPDQGEACRFTAIARSTTGGRGLASVETQRVVLEERMEVALRQVWVSVGRSRLLSPLAQEDFRLFDNGVEQPLASFGRGDSPLSALLLVDASESMRGESLASAFAAARTFLAKLGPGDEAAVMVFADRVLALTPFGPPEPGMLEGVTTTSAVGGTALDDHLYAALRMLDDRSGRRVVVLLSDGADVLSALTAEDVMWKVRRSDAAIFWLRLHPHSDAWTFSSSWRGPEANRRETAGLLAAVEESGGRVQPLEGLDELGAAFNELLGELRQQYVLGYYPQRVMRDGSWRPIEVKVNGFANTLRLRYRPGWVDR